MSACIAIEVGVRPDICTIDVPSLTRLVRWPHQASGVNASEPQASAVKTASKPQRSASATSSPTPSGGCAPQYPSCSPSFIADHPLRPP